ncbi:MAG: radical SAM protein [Ilumatobacteraceae bacterium]
MSQRRWDGVDPGLDFGVYVHVPFCTKRCDYCAFATWTDRAHLTEAYVDAVCTDLARQRDLGMPTASSVFFGGGTPSLLDAESIARIIASIERRPGAEVTVECNPDTVSFEKLAGYAAGGVERLSFGVQSMVDHVLVALGRSHDPDNVRAAVSAARRAGSIASTLDLIYGGAGGVGGRLAPHDRGGGVARRRPRERLRPHRRGRHTLGGRSEPASRRRRSGRQVRPRRRTAHRGRTRQLRDLELGPPGEECRHNLLYWAQGNYYGAGCAAHSHLDGRRWWAVRSPERYVERVQAGLDTERAGESLDDDERRIEGLQLALRTRDGVPVGSLDTAGLDEFVEDDGVRVRLTRPGE